MMDDLILILGLESNDQIFQTTRNGDYPGPLIWYTGQFQQIASESCPSVSPSALRAHSC